MGSMWRSLRALCALIVASALTACASGGAPGSLPIPAHAAGQAGSAKSKVKATIRIAIPRHKHRRRVLVRGRYVSPATESIAIALTPASGPVQQFNADLTLANNPGCTESSVSSLICTVPIVVAPGTYTATFATYDGPLSGGNAPDHPPTGNELSANQSVSVKIVSGASNAIGVTLDGIPKSVVIVPDASATLSGNMANGFALAKCSSPAQKVSVFGVDADGNYILGAGAPVPALASNDAADLPITATPAPSSPNRFTLTPPALPNGNAVVQLTATVTPASGSGEPPLTAHVNVTISGTICGTLTEFPVPTSLGQPWGIAVGSDGALWFTECNGNKIGRIPTDATPNSSAQITEFPTPSGGTPRGITAGPDGALWFGESGGGNVGRIPTNATPGSSAQITEYPTPSGSGPSGITTGPDGALWFTEPNNAKVGRIPTSATPGSTGIQEYGSANDPVSIVTGPDGALWYTGCLSGKIGTLSTSDTNVNSYTTPTNNGYPFGIASGPDGLLWFTEQNEDLVGRITTSGAIVEYPMAGRPFGIVTGPDGYLWVALGDGNAVVQMTTAGTITATYPVSTAGYPFDMVVGPDGALWFTEEYGNKIGRLQ